MEARLTPIFSVLRSSTNNDERKAAERSLAELQRASPAAFVECVLSLLASRCAATSDGLLVAAALADFATNVAPGVPAAAWPEAQRDAATQALLNVLLLGAPSMPLATARKLSLVLGVLLRHALPKKLNRDEVPPRVATPLGQIAAAAAGAATAEGEARRDRALLVLHLVLKQLQARKVGRAFSNVCARILPSLLSWLAETQAAMAAGAAQQRMVLLLKIALRAALAGDEPHAQTLSGVLHLGWALARSVATTTPAGGGGGDGTRRCLEYCLKILERGVTEAPARSAALGAAFFLGDASTAGTALVPLLATIVALPRPQRASLGEKVLCRAMRTLKALFELDDSSDFHRAAICAPFAAIPLPAGGATDVATAPCCPEPLIRALIVEHLGDCGGADGRGAPPAEWATDPERVVAELDVVDDEDAPASCAEQLFLALTTAPSCAPRCVAAAWATANALLAANEPAGVTSALHAVGLGYSALAQDPASVQSYLQFLSASLLPIIQNDAAAAAAAGAAATAAAARVPLVVVRRVVWVVGMWCESVTDVAHRRAVHATLQRLLAPQTNAAVLLTALRAVSHFVSDNQMTLAELPCEPSADGAATSSYIATVVNCVAHVLPCLRTAPMVQELAGLLSVLAAKGALGPRGGAVVLTHALIPALNTALARAAAEAAAAPGASDSEVAAAAAAAGEEDPGDDSDGSNQMVAIPNLLTAATEALRCCDDTAAMLGLLPVLLHCSDPQQPVTMWAGDEAWDALLQLARFLPTAACAADKAAEAVHHAFRWAAHNAVERDFSALPVAMRCAGALLFSIAQGSSSSDAFAALPAEVLRSLAATAARVLTTADSDAVPAAWSLAHALLVNTRANAAAASVVAAALLPPVAQYVAVHARGDIQTADGGVACVAVLCIALLAFGLPVAGGAAGPNAASVVAMLPANFVEVANDAVDATGHEAVLRWVADALQRVLLPVIASDSDRALVAELARRRDEPPASAEEAALRPTAVVLVLEALGDCYDGTETSPHAQRVLAAGI